jgi:hypothetical protein
MLKELKSIHKNVLQLSFNGYKTNEIAEKLEIHPVTVTNILSSELGKSYLEGLNDRIREASLDVRKELISMNKEALATFKRLLDPKSKVPASVQFSTAKDIFDRNGYKAPDKLSIDMTFKTKSDEELDAEIAALENSINHHNIKQTHTTELPTDNILPTDEAIQTTGVASVLKEDNPFSSLRLSSLNQAQCPDLSNEYPNTLTNNEVDNSTNNNDYDIVNSDIDLCLDENFDPFNNIER